jgi:glucan phosphoethanolaminetransferase (alkaline phosphatase superfamily)
MLRTLKKYAHDFNQEFSNFSYFMCASILILTGVAVAILNTYLVHISFDSLSNILFALFFIASAIAFYFEILVCSLVIILRLYFTYKS